MVGNAVKLNYDVDTSHIITIKAISNHLSHEEIKNFTVYVEDKNDEPYDLEFYPVQATSNIGEEIGTCKAYDEDKNQTLIYRLENSNENYPFDIYPNGTIYKQTTGILTNNIYENSCIDPIESNSFDYQDTENVVRIIIECNDIEEEDHHKRYRRQAADSINLPPEDLYFNLHYLSVPENSRDFDIADLYVVDSENDNFTCVMFTWDVPNDQQPFEIVNRTLRTSLTMHNNIDYDLDYETTHSYNITVTCYDQIHHNTIAKNFSIDIADINEAPVDLILSPNTLPENAHAGYIIGNFTVTDPDYPPNQIFDLFIVDDPADMFRLEGNLLVLTKDNDIEACIIEPERCPHDFEQIQSLRLRVMVEDYGLPRAYNKFWIEVIIIDENDPPVNLRLDDNIVAENSPIGTLIGSFSAQDQDIYQILNYTLLDDPSGLFYMDGNTLRLGKLPDYEKYHRVTITVEAKDNGTEPKNIIREFTIEILDVNEFPQTYVYIPPGNDPTNNTINDLLMNKIQSKQPFVFPSIAYNQPTLGKISFLMEDTIRELTLNGTNPELSFSIPTCEPISNSLMKLCTSTVIINNPIIPPEGYRVKTTPILNNNNEAKQFPYPLQFKFENTSLTIDNHTIDSIIISKDDHGKEIGLVGAIDTRTNQTIHNVIFNGTNNTYPIEIVNLTLIRITDDVNFDLIKVPMYNISFMVQDENNEMIEKTITIYLKDKSDFNLTLSNNKITENPLLNSPIGDLILQNGIGNYTFLLIDDTDGRFKLNGTTLSVAKHIADCHSNGTCLFDYEKEKSLNITVAVIDPATNQTLRNVTLEIFLIDENEAPYNLTLSDQSISENTPVNSTIAIIHAVDDDFNQTLTYTLDSPVFGIVGDKLVLKHPVNYETKKFYPLMIRATDNGHPPLFVRITFVLV
ncbi:unnamed protein product [Didymodactylos carnosus]|uniref:Cadherin domain-containing protein n=1 Tax=Didymodactylos carnosus TaxID=1234261 RepID=A0A8S2IA47_9BILA|nr:unnamed protein product [Didymodactylos carnosus]CAF3728507.1 unnamed protein product [Didymodactylos carnosus]